MALASRRGGNRFSASIWPGFVDVMTALILVLFFVLSIFMIVQFVLRETITGKDRELDALSVQVANLADALGLARSEADTQEALVATLTDQRAAAEGRIVEFEEQVAGLLARNQQLTGTLATAEAARDAAAAESAERLTACAGAGTRARAGAQRGERRTGGRPAGRRPGRGARGAGGVPAERSRGPARRGRRNRRRARRRRSGAARRRRRG